MLKSIESPCDQKYINKGIVNFLKIYVSYPESSIPSRFTHFKIQNEYLVDLINFTLTEDESILLEGYLSNKNFPLLPLTLISTLQRTIVVTKVNSSVYSLHIQGITFDGNVFESSYSFITPFLED